jgi:hypothetical protein
MKPGPENADPLARLVARRLNLALLVFMHVLAGAVVTWQVHTGSIARSGMTNINAVWFAAMTSGFMPLLYIWAMRRAYVDRNSGSAGKREP